MKVDVIPGDFSDERLKYLYLSARLGTMRAAADAFGVAPSSVSRQIAQLERYLRQPLVEKGVHKVRLTAAGELVVAHYQERLAHKEVLLSKLDDLQGIRTGRYALAVGEGFISTVLMSCLERFTQKFPKVELDVLTANTPEVISMITEDRAHIGFVFSPAPDPRIRVQMSVPQPLKAVVRADHPLANRSAVTLTELSNHPLILTRSSFRIRSILESAEREERVLLKPMVTTNSMLLMTEGALRGLGVAVMSELPASRPLASGELVAISIDNPTLKGTTADVITRLGRQLPSGAQLILDTLRRTLSTT
jgi:DNA-binding transcriptional LysR family regulator